MGLSCKGRIAEVCQTGAAAQCCQIGTTVGFEKRYRSFCVNSCGSCVPETGSETALCPANDKPEGDIRGCVTGHHEANINALPQFAALNELLKQGFSRRADPAARAFTVAISTDPINCQDTCKNNPEFCRALLPERDRVAQLRVLRQTIASQKGELAMDRIHSIFKVDPKDDPCERSNTVFRKDGTFENVAPKDCNVAATVYSGSGQPNQPLTLVVPKVLSGRMAATDKNVTFSFPDADTAFKLRIEAAKPAEAFSGIVNLVQTTEDQIFISTADACMRVDMSTPK
jgi:hypothetical protein